MLPSASSSSGRCRIPSCGCPQALSLSKRHEAIDWELFRPALEALVVIIPKGPGGQRPFDPLLMFKALVLGRLHNLSDAALERQIRKDLSFMSHSALSLPKGFLGLTRMALR